MWLHRRCSDPTSSGIVFQRIWSQLAAACLVQQTAIPSFAWRQPFDCSSLHLQCQQVLCSLHPSVPSTVLAQIVNPLGPNDGWMFAKASTTLARRAVPREELGVFPLFFRMLSCSLGQPKTDGACRWHTAQAMSPQHQKPTQLPA